jgi:hypothetical protein
MVRRCHRASGCARWHVAVFGAADDGAFDGERDGRSLRPRLFLGVPKRQRWPLLVAGVADDDGDGSGDRGERPGSHHGVQRVGGGGLVEVDEPDGGQADGVAHGDEGLQGAADLSVLVGVEAAVEAGHEGVEQQQDGVGGGRRERDALEVERHFDSEAVAADVFHVDAVDAVEVGAGGHEPGHDGVFPGVFGGAHEDVAGSPWCARRVRRG